MTRTIPLLKKRLLSGTVLSVVGMGVALAIVGLPDGVAQSQNPCAAKKPVAGKAVCNPCNPCAAAATPCNPCAAASAAGERTYTIRPGDSLADVAQQTYGDAGLYWMLADYNGIADPDLIVVGQVIRIPANPCNPCNPCAAQAMAGASDCVVPRLQTAALQNPCAAANPCNPCNPCAAAKPGNPCNPCAGANPCNPCAANPCAAANLCNPCAAANPCNPCNPCAPAEAVELTPAEATAAYDCIKGVMKAAYTGEMRQAAGAPCNPCNPCAAANPCNPCAAVKPVNPCNPCGATNPCKPGAALSPCNPQAVQMAAVTGELMTVAQQYQGWERLNTQPYVSATHGSRYVNNYPAPEAAEAYGRFEEVGAMPTGGRIAKDSFTVSPDGQVGAGPLFIMEKMEEGFNAASDDWRYAMIMPDGSLFGMTNGQGSQNVAFCAECHAIVADDQDSMYFMPEEFRVTAR